MPSFITDDDLAVSLLLIGVSYVFTLRSAGMSNLQVDIYRLHVRRTVYKQSIIFVVNSERTMVL